MRSFRWVSGWRVALGSAAGGGADGNGDSVMVEDGG